MKIFKSLIVIISLITSMTMSVYALGNSHKMMSELENSSVVSVSVRELDTNQVKYKKDSSKLLNPASSLKIFTFASALNTLGENYEFSTSISKDSNNNLYIKLGADPLLTYSNLRALVRECKNKGGFKKINKIYIDDKIIDQKPYPNGWLSDDLWPNMPKLSPYTLNQNKVTIKVYQDKISKNVEIFQENTYKLSLLNEVKMGDETKLSVNKQYGEDTDIINVKGTIRDESDISIPVNNPRYYFIANLKEIFDKEKIHYNKAFPSAKTPNNTVKLSTVNHSIKEVGQKILQDSDNFSSEIVFKIAGGKYKNKSEGSTQDGIDMFHNYYNSNNISTDEIQISDGSGVSRYNIFSTDWLSNALCYLFKTTNIKDYMATPNVGTLSRRLKFLDGRLWAKTGTLNATSALSGLVINMQDKELVFSIIIQNFNQRPSIIKSFEDDLIDEIFKLN